MSADNFKNILDLNGSTPEPTIRSGDTGQRIPCFDSCQLITTLMCNMSAISVFLCSQTSWKVWDWTLVSLWWARTGGRCTWLPNLLGWVDLLSYEAPLAHASRAWSSAMKTIYKMSGNMILQTFCLITLWERGEDLYSHKKSINLQVINTLLSL